MCVATRYLTNATYYNSGGHFNSSCVTMTFNGEEEREGRGGRRREKKGGGGMERGGEEGEREREKIGKEEGKKECDTNEHTP